MATLYIWSVKLNVSAVPFGLGGLEDSWLLVFSLREDPEAGSNTGKGQTSLSATVREKLSPPSVSFHLELPPGGTHTQGKSSCFKPLKALTGVPSSLCFSCFQRQSN